MGKDRRYIAGSSDATTLTEPEYITLITANKVIQVGGTLNNKLRSVTDIQPPINLGLRTQGDIHSSVLSGAK